jgi:hypothetical protein
MLGLGDYPMLINPEREAHLAEIIRDFAPNIILTHTQKNLRLWRQGFYIFFTLGKKIKFPLSELLQFGFSSGS